MEKPIIEVSQKETAMEALERLGININLERIEMETHDLLIEVSNLIKNEKNRRWLGHEDKVAEYEVILSHLQELNNK